MSENPSSPGDSPPTRSRRCLPWAVVGLLAVGGGAYFIWDHFRGEPAGRPLFGEMSIGIRASKEKVKVFRLDEEGALPVSAEDQMDLHVKFNQPAYIYLVWLDSAGRVVPLYPWNGDEIEVEDADQPPPVTRPTHHLMSPTTISNGWKFGPKGGMETVLLLARRSPLGASVKLGTMLKSVPAAEVRSNGELAILAWKLGDPAINIVATRNRGDEQEALHAEAPLRKALATLQEHFDVIHAHRFAHKAK